MRKIINVTYNQLPEGYPSKEQMIIEWDGDTTGLIVVDGWLYKVSDTVLTTADLIGATFTENTEVTTPVSAANISEGDGYIAIEDGMLVIVSEENAVFAEMTFPATGIYFEGTFDDPEYGDEFIAKFETTVTREMSEEFTPRNLSVVFKYDSEAQEWSCNRTYTELKAWIENDVPIVAVVVRSGTNAVVYYCCNGSTLHFWCCGLGGNYRLEYTSDGSVGMPPPS